MSFRQQPGRRGASKQFAKTATDKKTKPKKPRQSAKYLQEETPQISPQEVAQRALSGVERLGNQIFALSPFSNYFDDWLINLRQIVEDFESNPAIKVDEQFQKTKTQIFQDITDALAQSKLSESNLSAEAKALIDNNHNIAEADKEYAEKTRDLSNHRNSEITRLSNNVRQLEEELDAQQNVKVKFYQFNEKKRAQEKLDQLTKNLATAKIKSETTLQNFTAEQEKLHDTYEKRKQELNQESDRLHQELEKLETDTSLPARQTACNALTDAINELMKQTTPSA
jgi:DNA repair exonuclease SbcCD ATPase subunit